MWCILRSRTNDLSTNEVVAGGDVARNGEGEVAAVVVQNLGSPVVGVVRRETHLIDLEPVGARADGSDSIVNLGHVDVDRAVVVSLDGFGSAVRHHKKVFKNDN